MARAKKFILVSGVPKNSEGLISYIKRIPTILPILFVFYNVATVLTLYQALQSGSLSYRWGLLWAFLCFGSPLVILLSPYAIKPKKRLDLTCKLWRTPLQAALFTFCFVIVLDQLTIMNLIMKEQLNLSVWIVAFIVQFVVLFPPALCMTSYIEYGSKFRFLTGVVLKVLYGQWESKEDIVKRSLNALRWLYGKLGKYPFLKRGLTVTVNISSEKDSSDQELVRFSFPKNVYTSMEDVAEGCFVAKEYLVVTGQLDKTLRPWAKGAVAFVNSMISNPRFYSDPSVNYSTYKRTGRMLIEYGETLFRTMEDKKFEEYAYQREAFERDVDSQS